MKKLELQATLNILKRKRVNVHTLIWAKSCTEYNDMVVTKERHLETEEFNLLKRWVE